MKTSIGDITLNPKIKCFFLGHRWIFSFKETKHKCSRCGEEKYKQKTPRKTRQNRG